GFAPLNPPAGAPPRDPKVPNDNTAFYDDITRGYTQKAVFGSVDVDIIPKTLTFTAGTRWYKFDNSEVGSAQGSFGCYIGVTTTTPCTTSESAINLNAENLHSSYSGFQSRANFSWTSTAHVNGEYQTPQTFAPDSLTNNEIGWKTRWFDHRLEFNGTVYQEDWKNVQVEFYDPQGGLGNLEFETNGPNYRVRGLETQFVARVTHGLTVTGSGSLNHSVQTNSPFLIGVNGQPITSIPTPYGTPGTPLANSPAFQANLRARYEFAFNDYHAFWQVGAVHQSHSYSETGFVENFYQPGYTTYDASMGVAKAAGP